MSKKKKKKKKVPVKATRTKRVKREVPAIAKGKCKIKATNNDLPWEVVQLSAAHHVKFELGTKSFVIKYNENHDCLQITCPEINTHIQPIKVNEFYIK